MRLKFIALAISIFIGQLSFGQQIKISGKIIDKADASPIEYANITLLTTDSTFIKGVNSDVNGYFVMNGTPVDNYLLSVSYLGYETLYREIDNPSSNNDLGEIPIEASSFSLNEAVVTAQSVINKPDRKLITPSQAQIQASTSGLDLLQKLQLPRLKIDYINNTISMLGNGEVQLRINGRQVTNAEIVALRPDEIVRVEYYDAPGARFGNAAAVIDYITRHQISGGNVNGNGMNAITDAGLADDFLSAKFNYKKSEFSFNTYFHYRDIDWTRTNEETFAFPNEEYHRIENGLPSEFGEYSLNNALNYSILEQDKYFFNATLRYNWDYTPNAYTNRNSTLLTSDNPTPLAISDRSTNRANTPALDLYYQLNLKNEQLLIFNVVGTYIDSKNERRYTESLETTPVTDIYSHITGDKYSLIAEGIYERKLGPGRLSSGLKHTQIYANNIYTGTTAANVSMNQAESRVYAEYQLNKGKFNYMAGLSAVRFYFSQGDMNQEKYIVQPSVRVTYNPKDYLMFRYRFNLESSTPSLSDLNNVEQDMDSLQIQRGNPYLKMFYSLNNEFTADYNKGIFGFNLYASYNYQKTPIMESISFEDGKFIHTPENQKGFHRLNIAPTIKLKPFKDLLTVSVTPGLNRYISQGNNYTHTYTNKYIQVGLDAMYKNWVLQFNASTKYNWFSGETMQEGEALHFLAIGYNKPNWSIIGGAINPFGGDYKRYENNWSRLAPSTKQIYTNDLKQMFFIRASFNINFGRQFKGANKRINNSDNDSGIMSGAKK